MKTIFFFLFISFVIPLNAQIYSPNKTIQNKNEKGIQDYLFAEFIELNQPSISLQLTYRKNTKHAQYFSYEILYKQLPIFNNSIKLVVDNYYKVISIKKEINQILVLDNFNFDSEFKQWIEKDVSTFIPQIWKNEKIKTSAQLKLFFQEENPQIVLQINAWNQSLDQTILVDINRNVLLEKNHALNLLKDTTVSAKVFKPDPLTTLNKTYGGIYIDSNDANGSWMNSAYFTFAIPATFDDANNTFYLENKFVTIDDFESPTIAAATSSTQNFIFTRNQSGFEDCNIVYHISNFQNYISSIGYDTLMQDGITVDAHGQFGADNSVFMRNAGSPTLSFGTGGVDDAEDADVIIHEYCHGISWSANANDNFSNERSGLDEGIADYFATSYSREMNNFNWQNMFSWDGHNEFWIGRIANTTDNYGNTTNIYKLGEIWNSAMSASWTDLGNIVVDKLMLESLHFFTNNTTLPEAAIYVLKADTLLFNGINSPILCANFKARNILGNDCLPVSVESIQKENSIKIKNSLEFANGSNPLIISFDKIETGSYIITDFLGNKINFGKFQSSKEVSIFSDNLKAGIYLLTVNLNSKTQTIKIAKW